MEGSAPGAALEVFLRRNEDPTVGYLEGRLVRILIGAAVGALVDAVEGSSVGSGMGIHVGAFEGRKDDF
jgi:hypothetical protein